MNTFGQRLLRAIKLEASLYEEVEADPGALGQAIVVVLLSSASAGLALLFSGGAEGILLTILAALAGWLIWALTIFLIGVKIFPEPQTKSSLGELLRVLGFASAPGILRVFGIVPILAPVVMLAAGLWMLAATVVAVRQALDFKSTGKAVIVCLAGWLSQLALVWLVVAVNQLFFIAQ